MRVIQRTGGTRFKGKNMKFLSFFQTHLTPMRTSRDLTDAV